jgi:3-mercaptopropionate dioxygenase
VDDVHSTEPQRSETQRTGAQADEYFLDMPVLRQFIGAVREARGRYKDVTQALDALQPRFAALLADQSWLPDAFAAPYAASGMGGGIATWLLFRAGDRSLSLFSLVVPPGAATPIHDHLAWGFVGLYRGEQEETVYVRHDAPDHSHSHAMDETSLEETSLAGGKEHAVLSVAQVNALKPGDSYKLLPPDGDIHAVKTTSAVASVSIHLLANDTGCVIRHAFDPDTSTARAFRSGYSNVPCRDE